MFFFLSTLKQWLFGVRNYDWLELPFEMREMVIDRMDPKTRCEFAQYSKLCEEEVKASKKYLYGIKITRESHPELRICHEELGENYCLEFIDIGKFDDAKSIVIYTTKGLGDPETGKVARNLKWTKLESGEAEDVRIKYLNDFLEKYKKSMRRLEIRDEEFPIDQHNMQNLRNLEIIKCHINVNVMEIGFLNITQILRADYVYLKTRLSFDQVLQFQGSTLKVRSDDFDEGTINRYLRMWKNGELNRMKCFCLNWNPGQEIAGLNIIEGLDVYNFAERHTSSYRFSFCFDLNYEMEDGYYCEVIFNSRSLFIHIDNESYNLFQ